NRDEEASKKQNNSDETPSNMNRKDITKVAKNFIASVEHLPHEKRILAIKEFYDKTWPNSNNRSSNKPNPVVDKNSIMLTKDMSSQEREKVVEEFYKKTVKDESDSGSDQDSEKPRRR